MAIKFEIITVSVSMHFLVFDLLDHKIQVCNAQLQDMLIFIN